MSIATCPHCGRSIQLTKTNTRSTGWQTMARFESAIPAIAQTQSAPQFAEARRETPARPASVESDVLVPGAQAVATGVAVCVVAIPASVYFGWHWTTPLTAFAVTTAVTWLTLLGAHRRLLWTVETIINRDIDGDGATGKSVKQARVEVEVRRDKTTQLDDLPGPIESLREFACDVNTGRTTFSERGARKSGYGVTAYRELRDIFLRRGWAVWSVPGEPRQGVKLTHPGKAVLRGIETINQ